MRREEFKEFVERNTIYVTWEQLMATKKKLEEGVVEDYGTYFCVTWPRRLEREK